MDRGRGQGDRGIRSRGQKAGGRAEGRAGDKRQGRGRGQGRGEGSKGVGKERAVGGYSKQDMVTGCPWRKGAGRAYL